jgi:hypothetical protein
MRRRLIFVSAGLILLVAMSAMGGASAAAMKTRGYRWTIEGAGVINIDFGNKQGALRNGPYLASWNWKATGVVVYEEFRNIPNLDGLGQRFELETIEDSGVTQPDFSDLTHQRRKPLCKDLQLSVTAETSFDSEKYKGTALDLTRGRLRWDAPRRFRNYQWKCKPAESWMGLQGPFHYDIPAPSRKNFRTGTEFHKTLKQSFSHEFGESHPGANIEPHSFNGTNELTVTFEHIG